MLHQTRWTLEKIAQYLALLDGLEYRQRAALPDFRYQELPSPAADPPVGADVADAAWPQVEPGTYWGRPAVDFALRGAFQIPAGWDAGQPLCLVLPLGDAANFSHPETLVYIDGQPYAACDRHHQEIRLRPSWADGQAHRLALHGWTGLGGSWNHETLSRLVMRPCFAAQVDVSTRRLQVLGRVSLETARALDENAPARGALLNALNAAFNRLDTREPFGEAFYASVPEALACLEDGVRRAGAPLESGLAATGHAHIDVAWLWTLDQTRRKAGRTFHTVLRLMEQFPDYHFTQSQPQLYEFIRRDYPAAFEQIRARVAEGRWEPTGGMWVEADCNLSGAESLARQFLLGRSFFRQHFGAGAESPVLWLPDVFGYAWALPQLIKQAGLEYFFTIKLGWNQYNRIPYDSFWWQGLDGTRVLTHFSTAPEDLQSGSSTYNAPATPASALGAWHSFQQKELQSEVLMAYGYGDGGGGPTREMVENLEVMAHFPGLPQARQRPVGAFFRDLEQQAGPQLPTWNGELYLELHRGTYTTQSRNKRANRKSEFLLHDVEFLASLASLLDPSYAYPAETFRQAWRLVCLNQFHDIIPGSSIGPVYQESLRQYAEIARLGDGARQAALASLAASAGGDLLIANPTSFARRDLAFFPGEWSGGLARAGRELALQAVEGGVLIDAGELPPYSLTPLQRTPGPAPQPDLLAADHLLLENAHLRAQFNQNGELVQLFDKDNQREVLPEGAVGNQLQAFEDRPKAWDAWDIDIYYDDKLYLAEPGAEIRRVEAGPLRQALEFRRTLLHSQVIQRVSLAHNAARLDFETRVDWRERHILLKVAFPVDILAPAATYEIQWGSVQRPTHRNTSWDWARFETCAHKWVDLSEGGYGVSLLNDCKYGHDIQGNVLRLSLLRSPTVPDPEADQGEQRFTYSLLPHAGGWEEVTAAQAYALNDPLIVYRPSEGRPTAGRPSEGRTVTGSPTPLVQVSAPNLIIETVKRAEDGRGLVVRLYESQRRRGAATLTAAFPLAGAQHTNLLEETQSILPVQGCQVQFTYRPFEIITLRLLPGVEDPAAGGMEAEAGSSRS